MKEKILYSSAIVSDELYVERYADRKLQDVIKRMSKPAYISVARQMGKTNLLIHAKRALENENNRYVYIDVTSDFKTAQDCFRYIVNQILNSNEDIEGFSLAREKILSSRKESVINASEEYQNEIREILKCYKGNLVIFLDEVDDLRKHSFSDDIFGQIRKTYFIRETYPVLNRVAYILSGVIDPEKLIKTKENSPFNIAIPIYLEDFNKDEFYELVYKSGLELDNNVKDYTFNWLQGNPRMSFEILSIVEDYYIKGVQITNDLIDEIINVFYLTNFKNPPVDHIRDVVNHNTDLRKALIKFKKGLLNELSDEDINKFYLFGITASKIKKENLKIKNKVLELSLSDEWLGKIELQKKGYLALGREKIEEGNFSEGVNYLEEYIHNEPDSNGVAFVKFEIGEAYFKDDNPELSNKYLLDLPIDKEKLKDFYYLQLSYIGANFFKLEKFDEAIKYYDEIIDSNESKDVVIVAFVNKGESLINLKPKYDNETIIKIFLSALDYIEANFANLKDKETFKTIIYYRLGYLTHDNGNKDEAKIYFAESLKYSKIYEQPNIMLYIDSCVIDNDKERAEIYKKLSNLIIENNLVFSKNKGNILTFVEHHLFIILTNLYDFELFEEFYELCDYSIDKIYESEINKYQLFYRVAFFALQSNDLKVCKGLLTQVLEIENIDLQTRMVCNQFLGLISFTNKDKKQSNYLIEYVEIFNEQKNFNNIVKPTDIYAFIALINYYRDNDKRIDSFKTASILEQYFYEDMDDICKLLSLGVLFIILQYYYSENNIVKSREYSETILSIILILKQKSSDFNESDLKDLEYYETQTNLFMRGLNWKKNIVDNNDHITVSDNSENVKIKEPERNQFVIVRYKDGREVRVKYKKIILDIKSGNCELVIG